MSGCRQCGSPTPNRLCQQCQVGDRDAERLTNICPHPEDKQARFGQTTARGEAIVERRCLQCERTLWTGKAANDPGPGGDAVVTDGGQHEPLGDFERDPDDEPAGAVDNAYSEAERDAVQTLEDALAEVDAPMHGEWSVGDVAFDLVQRQPLVVTDILADSLVEYYEAKDFDLASYKTHPWMPVRTDDAVLECVFIGTIEGLHSFSRAYAYPEGRLARLPVELAGGDE